MNKLKSNFEWFFLPLPSSHFIAHLKGILGKTISMS